MRRYYFVALLVIWAAFVAIRNTVFDNHQWQYWFLIMLGAVCVFVAGRSYERTHRVR